MTSTSSQRLVAEALGTGILVAAVVGSGIMAAKLSGGNMAIALLCNTIPTGAILYVLITILGPVSGAHFNPVVTGVMAMRGEIGAPEAGGYVVAQVVGGCLGSLLAHGMFGLPILQVSATVRGGSPHPRGAPGTIPARDPRAGPTLRLRFHLPSPRAPLRVGPRLWHAPCACRPSARADRSQTRRT
jgi:glycerol uptake facilitator-like aquaporin